MSEMVERVARAIVAEYGPDGWDADDYRRMARAAIAAMREPTDAMIDVLNRHAQCEGFIEEGWRAAMDEALRNE